MRKRVLLLVSMTLAVLLAGGVALVGVENPAEAAFPGENGKIAFVSSRDYQDGGSLEIYSMNADGTDQERVTNSPRADQWPVWSPDGTRIAFVSERDHNEEIYVMNSDGTDQTRLTSNPTGDWHPTWSPDGMKLAFMSERDGQVDIYVMNTDGTDQTRLTNTPGQDLNPAWSPDGEKIAFDNNVDIYLMNADGTGQTRLTSDQAGNSHPAWSPDGARIALASSRQDQNKEIYVMNADGTNLVRLTTNPAADIYPAWSPRGEKIAFTTNRDGAYTEIYVMNVDGTDQANLTNSPLSDALPDWQPLPSTYNFSGFFSPVNNLPSLNSTKAGNAVPVKFSLDGDQGLDVFATDYPKSQQIDCDSTAQVDSIEQTATAGESSLSYDATTDQYTYVWKTKEAWAGTCRQFTMKLDDGTTHLANFKFRN